jgi:hypothetical protein
MAGSEWLIWARPRARARRRGETRFSNAGRSSIIEKFCFMIRTHQQLDTPIWRHLAYRPLRWNHVNNPCPIRPPALWSVEYDIFRKYNEKSKESGATIDVILMCQFMR